MLESRGGHGVEVERYNKSLLCTMKYLSDITEKHIDTICQALHDTIPEYDYDRWLQVKLYKIRERLSDNPSMYQLSSEELDLLSMTLNDTLFVLDDIMKDLDDLDLRDCREYREEIERLLGVFQRN